MPSPSAERVAHVSAVPIPTRPSCRLRTRPTRKRSQLPGSVSLVAASLFAANPTENRQIDPQTGDAMYYDAGVGASGVNNVASDPIAAGSHAPLDSYPGYAGGNPNNNPICGKWAMATYNGHSLRFQVEARYGGCPGFGDPDFSCGEFATLFGSLDAGRVSGVTWTLDGDGGSAPPDGNPPVGCTKTHVVVSGA